MIVYHGTNKEFTAFDKRAPGSQSIYASLHEDAHFFTASPDHAAGYAGSSVGANVRRVDVDTNGAIEVDAAGIDWQVTQPLLVSIICNDLTKQEAISAAAEIMRDEMYRLRWGGARETWHVKAAVGRRNRSDRVAARKKLGEKAMPHHRKHFRWDSSEKRRICEVRRALRDIIDAFVPSAKVAVVRNSSDMPLGGEVDGPHDVVIVHTEALP